MISKYLKILVELTWIEYVDKVCEIPNIDNIRLSAREGAAGEFLTADLYSKQYILYLSEEMEVAPDEYVKEILFHEFTHLADSLMFLDYSFEDFKKIMYIYSEIHAAEIQMDKILSITGDSPDMLRQVIPYKGVMLKDFLNKGALEIIKEQFSPLKEKVDAFERCDFVYIYYFVGYLLSLKKHNIEYTHDYTGIIKPLIPEIIEIEDYFLTSEKINPQEVMDLAKNLESAFKIYYFSFIQKSNMGK